MVEPITTTGPDWLKLKEEFEKDYPPYQDQPEPWRRPLNPRDCPHCGRCPSCGRGSNRGITITYDGHAHSTY